MQNARYVICGDVKPELPGGGDADALRLHLYGRDDEHKLTLRIEDIRRQMFKNVPARFHDLLDLATYVYAADQAVDRGMKDVETLGSFWRRQFHFFIPLRDLDFWRSTEVSEVLADTVGFLSDDRYEFSFLPLRGEAPLQSLINYNEDGEYWGGAERVVMYSGGLDSLGGAIEEAVVQKRRVVLVNHRATQKLDNLYRTLQSELDAKAPNNAPSHIRVTVQKKKWMNKGPTQRSRSFLYVALGAAIAEMLGTSEVRFYENGVIGLNLPICAQVVGGNATRTTHPRVIHGFRTLLSLVADRPFQVENPFQWLTKGEVAESIERAGCAELIGSSISCTHTWDISIEHPHCGYCSQCIDRRFAILAKGLEQHDPVSKYGMDIFTESRSKHEHVNEDKMLFANYVERANQTEKIEDCLQFLKHFPEVARALPYLEGDPGQSAQRCYDLYRRHSAEVTGVIDKMLSLHGPAIRRRTLPADAMMRIVYESDLPSSMPVVPAREEQLPQNVFRRSGLAWQVRFNGQQPFTVLPRLGASYIHYMLVSPNEPRPAIDIVCNTAIDFCDRAISAKEAIDAGLQSASNPLLRHLGNVSDWQAVEQYKKEAQELLVAIEDARRENNNVMEQQHENDLAMITSKISEAVNISGKLRLAKDRRKNIRDSFRNNVKRVIEGQIRGPDPALATHLEKAITFGNLPRYVPEDGLTWETRPVRND